MSKWHRVIAGILALGLVAAAACGGDDDDTEAAEREGPTVKVGAQDFGESAILAEIYKQALEADGFKAEVSEVKGFRDLLFAAVDKGDVNMAPEYVASELNFLKEGAATSDVEESLNQLEPELEKKGLVAFTPSEAVDTNTFVMTKEKSDDLGIETMSDLAEKGKDFTLGAPEDCPENPFCIPGLQEHYSLDLSGNFQPLSLELVPASLEDDAIDVGVFTSTSGQLTDDKFVALEDDKGMLAADNVFPMVSKDLADAYGSDLEKLMDKISAALTTDDLIEMNERYEVDHDDADDIASDWLEDQNLK